MPATGAGATGGFLVSGLARVLAVDAGNERMDVLPPWFAHLEGFSCSNRVGNWCVRSTIGPRAILRMARLTFASCARATIEWRRVERAPEFQGGSKPFVVLP